MEKETLALQCGGLQGTKANENGENKTKTRVNSAGVDINFRHPLTITSVPECNEHQTLKGYDSCTAAP